MSRLVKILLIAAGSLAAFLVIAAIVAVILFPADKVRALVEEQGAEALGMPVSVGDIGLSFRGIPSVRVSDLTIGPARAGEPPLVTLKSVNVRVALLKLLWRQVEIVSVDIASPEITMITREDKTTNLPGGEEPKPVETPTGPPPLPIPITMKKLAVDNGRVELINRADSTRIVLAGLAASMNMRIPRDLTAVESVGKTTIDSLAFYPPKGAPIGGVTAIFTHEVTGNLAEGSAELTKGLLTVNGLPVRVTGGMTGWTTYTFAAETGDIGFDIALAALPAGMIPDQDKLRADGSFSLTVSGSLDASQEEPLPEFTGTVAFNGSDISFAGLPKSIDEVSGNIAFTQERIDIADLQVSVGNSSLTAGGTVTGYMGENPVVNFDSTGDLNLDDITGAVPLPEGVTATGRITYDITLEGAPADPSSFAATGGMSLQTISATMPELLKNPAELDGAFTLTAAALRVDRFSFNSGVSKVAFDGQISNYMALTGLAEGDARFNGALRSDMLDLNDLLVTPKEKPVAPMKPWDLEPAMRNLPIPPNFAADLTVRTGPVIFGKLKADSSQARLTLEKGVLQLTGLDAAAYDGSITGNSTVNFTDIEHVTYDGSYAVKALESSRFIADFFGVGDIVSGTFSSNLKFTGAGLDSVSMLDNLRADGDMAFADGTIHNWEFTKKLSERVSFLDFDTITFESITNSFRVENRRMYTPDMAIEASIGDIRANGSVGFDTTLEYKYTLILTEAASKRAVDSLSELANIFSGDTGRLEFTIDATGTVRSPSFSLDTSAARQQLQQRLTDKVKEEAGKVLEKQGEDLKEKGKELLDKLFR